MKGFVPIPVLVLVIALIAIIASITVLGSPQESARPIEYICEQIPDAAQCQSSTPIATGATTEICTKEVEGIEVKYPCASPSPAPAFQP